MTKRSTKVLAGFIAGQAVQIVCHVLTRTAKMELPVAFCSAAGFLVLVAIVAGVVLAEGDKSETKREKTHIDYVQIPSKNNG